MRQQLGNETLDRKQKMRDRKKTPSSRGKKTRETRNKTGDRPPTTTITHTHLLT